MKPESIDRQKKLKREAVASVAVFALIQTGVALGVGALGLMPGLPVWISRACLVIAVLSAAGVIPAVRLIKIRFQEIEGGELDEAGKY